jgi:predicted kinase
MSKTTDNLLAFSLLGSLAATAVTGIALYHMTGLRRGGDAQHQAGEEKYIRSTSNDSDYLKRNPTSFFHPEGPNIGPSSTENWLHREGDLPAKTDLLHKGHVKGGLLVLAMVGLPGRGKTYIARKVARYLRWINYRTRAFSLARYRIEQFGPRQAADFYDNANETNVTVRQDLLKSALDDMMHYLSRGGECVILDGTNFTKERRQLIRDRVAREDGHEILWVESSTDDVSIIDKHLKHLQDSSPDFLSAEDFEARVAHYREVYEPVEMEEGSYVKIFDAGKRIEIHQAQGFLPTKITSFLMNMHISLVRPVYITRHGESMFNVEDKIGGDPDLSPMGKQYAEELVKFVENCPDLPKESLCVWSSTMKRARQTSKSIKCARYVEWRALREIEVRSRFGLNRCWWRTHFISFLFHFLFLGRNCR